MKPYQCPVCNGRGTVPLGFYGGWGVTTNTAHEQCKSCVGAGIVWAGNEGENAISILDLYEFPKTTGGGKI